MPCPRTSRRRRDPLPPRLPTSTAQPPPPTSDCAPWEDPTYSSNDDYGPWEDHLDSSPDSHWYPGRSINVSLDSDYKDDQEDAFLDAFFHRQRRGRSEDATAPPTAAGRARAYPPSTPPHNAASQQHQHDRKGHPCPGHLQHGRQEPLRSGPLLPTGHPLRWS